MLECTTALSCLGIKPRASELVQFSSCCTTLLLQTCPTLTLLLPGPSGEGAAQSADPLPQRHRRVLRREPAAAGADAQTVPHQVEIARGRQSILARRAALNHPSDPRTTGGPPRLGDAHPAPPHGARRNGPRRPLSFCQTQTHGPAPHPPRPKPG